MLQNKVVSNATWIIICRVFQAILNMVITMMTARYFGPSNYGIINYAAAVVAFFIPIMQLGLRSTLVQEYINNSKDEGVILGTSVVLNIISSICCIVGVFAFVAITSKNERDTIIVCLLYSFVLLFQATEMIQYWFQAKLLSKYTSVISLGAYAITSIYKIYLLITGKSIYWFAVANAFDYLIISAGLFLIYKKIGKTRITFSYKIAKKLLKRSKYYIVSNMMVTVFGYVGSIILKYCMDTKAVALYSVCITCAGMTSFVFNALIDSARPVILAHKAVDQLRFQKSMVGLYSVIIYASLLQSVFICAFSGVIINTLYGAAYSAAVFPLKIISWYAIFSYFGPVRNVWILAEEKQQYLWIINFMGAIISIILNIVFIPLKGVIGAAIAALATQFFTNVITGYLIPPIRECNKLMLRGLNPRNIYELIINLAK